MTDKQQAIFDLIVELKERAEQATKELADLNRWIHEEAPRIAVEAMSKVSAERDAAIQRAKKAETERDELRIELSCIANARMKGFEDDRDFRLWAQNRARSAIGQEAGTLVIKKGNR